MNNIDFHTPIVIDFETYYDKEFSLSKITTEKYIRDDKFECIGVSVKVGNLPTQFYRKETGLPFIKVILEQTYPNSPVVSHNNSFDMGILGLRYNIHPKFMIDTATMAKLCGLDRVTGGVSLAKLSQFLVTEGIAPAIKGDTVHNMLGVHADDMREKQWQEYGEYCKLDTDLCYALYKYLINKVPKDELVMADITTKMWTKPMVSLDVPLLENYAIQLENEKESLLNQVRDKLGFSTNDELLANLRSSSKFINILERLGVEAPMKFSEKQQKMIPAVSKTDQEFLELLEHDDQLVRRLVEVKLGTASSMEQTRTETFLDIASRGNMPIPLRYASAHTGRYGGCFVAETIVCLKSKNPFDPSPYYANIIDATSDTLIWNGEEFVEHDGVICNGVQEVINYDGLCGTRGHKVFTESGIVSLEHARNNMLPIIDCSLPSSTTIYPIQGTRPVMTYADGAVVPVYDILNAGKDHKYMANGKLVHNSDKVNLQNLSKRTKEPVLRRSLRPIDGHVWVAADSAQIEARVLSYLANQKDVVDVFVSGRDVYIDMATKIYGESYETIYDQSKGANATKDGKMKRNIAKAVVLGCGYGASANKFAELMVQQGLGEQAGMAESLISTYRSANYNIVNFWKKCDYALGAMLSGDEYVFGGENDDIFVASGITVFHGVKIPTIKLPNGTYIFYQNLRQEVSEDGRLNYVYDQFKGRGFQPKRIWGSALAENLCQALSFAVLKYQAININNHGVPINLNVHDEWASVVPREQAPAVCKIYYQCMKQTPYYLPDGLLDCEVDVGLNYADLKTIDVGAFV